MKSGCPECGASSVWMRLAEVKRDRGALVMLSSDPHAWQRPIFAQLQAHPAFRHLRPPTNLNSWRRLNGSLRCAVHGDFLTFQ
jgi:hypothetical protein